MNSPKIVIDLVTILSELERVDRQCLSYQWLPSIKVKLDQMAHESNHLAHLNPCKLVLASLYPKISFHNMINV